MSTQRNKTPIAKALAEFKGLDDWFDVFYAGEHTDSLGRKMSFDTEYLNQLVENSKATDEQPHQVPFVVGHPKTDAPAYGWGLDFKVEDGVLYAKGHQVEEQFADLVKDGRYPNRSVKIVEDENGPRLAHIGFLGAAAPALDGLKKVYNADQAGHEFEFSTTHWYGTSTIARFMREFLIEKFGREKADEVISDWDVQQISEIAGEQRAEENSSLGYNKPPNSNTHYNQGDSPMEPNKDKKTFTQEELDAAIAKARDEGTASGKTESQAEFAQQRAEAGKKSFIDAVLTKAKDAGRLVPAREAGLREFMATLSHDATEEHVLEFSKEAGQTEKVSALSWFAKTFLEEGPLHPLLKPDVSGPGDPPSVDIDDGVVLGTAASEYMAEQAAKGITVTATQAVTHIQSQQSAA